MIGTRAVNPGRFLDLSGVSKFVEQKSLQGLNRIGGYVRKVARNSMRDTNKVSLPGAPPSAHNRKVKDLLFYAIDQQTRSVVIGPMAFPNRRGNEGARTLEEGGEVTVLTKGGKSVVMVYRARPFMGPAFQKSLPKAVGFFTE